MRKFQVTDAFRVEDGTEKVEVMIMRGCEDDFVKVTHAIEA